MKAVLYRQFGPVSVLAMEELAQPQPGPNDILVKVYAASLNVIDSRSRRGEMSPFVNKKFPKIPCADLSGVVAAVGPNVHDLKAGDEVLGATNAFKGGTLAEYAVVPRKALAVKPASLSWEEAAALPVAGVAALRALRDLGQLRRGQSVLIHGSSGGVGTFAVQIAKIQGAKVTAVSGPNGVDISRTLGANECIDYTQSKAPLSGTYDLILNFSGHLPYKLARPLLSSTGKMIEPSPTISKFLGSKIANLFRRQKHLMLAAETTTSDLNTLLRFIAEKQLRIIVGNKFPFSQPQVAFTEFEKGGTLGKLVVGSFG